VDVGGVQLGGTHPIVVQSMTNTDTADVDATAAQVRALHEAGSELVRVTVNNEAAAEAVPDIVAGVAVPVIGDFHYNGHLLLTKYPKCAAALAKYRINPGNVGAKRRDEHFRTIIEVALIATRDIAIFAANAMVEASFTGVAALAVFSVARSTFACAIIAGVILPFDIAAT